MQLLVGRCGFEDISDPVAGKSEWGVDTLVRKLKGHRSLLAAFVGSLYQGQWFNGFYLQSWEPDDNTPVASVALYYKGLPGGTPRPIISNQVIQGSGSTSADFSLQNGGKGTQYGTGPDGKPLYAVGASMEFTYEAGETTYRYISLGQPNGPTYSALAFYYPTKLRRIRITTSDGAVFGKNVPYALGPSLLPVFLPRAAGFHSQPIVGTPYYECEDIVRVEPLDG